MRKRTLSRENALKILYQADVLRRNIGVVFEAYYDGQEKTDPVVLEFTSRLAKGVEKNLEKIDETISASATNWQLKRMAFIDRNVLRIGVFELIFADDIPPKVTINEAVDLAKKYGDIESSKFVNGILDKIHKTISN